ncbi:MAG: indolepyruvate oxidoreductase subunit beta [Armatimonadetes bacterium]|nr:indolepyruvate oxidoreductase subunit beta [Armatimonadota bacterium]
MSERVYNVVVAGLGGQGVIKASDILADAAFRSGYDVKKAEIHGMSQRGGSVSSDVRFGAEVLSPMVPPGEADILVVQEATQIDANRDRLKPDGLLIVPDDIDIDALANRRSANVAMLGVLSRHLPIADEQWHEAIRANLAENLWEANLAAFALGQGG